MSGSRDEGHRLSQCDLDCLALLGQAKEPLSGVRVRRELERCGIGVWAWRPSSAPWPGCAA
jgi:hypothetical protein